MLKKNYIICDRHFIFLVVLLFAIFWQWWLPGAKVANDFPIVSNSSLKQLFDIPRVWREQVGEGLGEYIIFTLWNWPIGLISGLLANIGLGFELQERLFYIIPYLLLGSYSIWKFLSKMKLSGPTKFVASLFYLVNTYPLLLIDGGQLSIALAYSWFPICYLFLESSLTGGLAKKILAALSVAVLVVLDIRFAFILFLLCLIRIFYQFIFLRYADWKRWIFNWLKSSLVVVAVVVPLNAYWILPLYYSPLADTVLKNLTASSNPSFTTIGHSITLLSPHWFKNVFGKITPIRVEFLLIPILVFLAPILKLKNKQVGFWMSVSLISIFLAKGSYPPLPQVYGWLFENFPGFSLFRDSTKFFFLIALSYSALVGITIDELVRRFNWELRIPVPFGTGQVVNWKFSLITLLLTTYFLLLIRPVWLGQMTGTFSFPAHKQEYYKAIDVLQRDKDFSRIFWIPHTPPLGYSSPTHPSLEAARLFSRRPFATGVVGTYEVFNFLREAPYIGQILDIAGVGYIAYPYPDTRREDLKQDNIDYYYAFLDQLDDKEWVEKRISEPPVALLKTKRSQDHFFLANNTFLVVGSDMLYGELDKIDNLRLSENALIFAEEKPGLGTICKDIPCKVILYEKSKIDFAATFIDKSRFIFPASFLNSDPDKSGWWKREAVDLIWWRNFLHEKYGIDNLDYDYSGGWAVAEGKKLLPLFNPQLSKGNMLLARVMISDRGGEINFYQGGVKIGDINTKSEASEIAELKLTGYKEIPDRIFEFTKSNVTWHEVGTLLSNEKLEIKAEGDINVVNALVTASESEWQRINELVQKYTIVNWSELSQAEKAGLFSSDSPSKISYERISSTNYKVNVEGLDKPATLAFSETYDSLWQIDGQPSYPLYSLINGFYIEKDGEYDIYFLPQKYVIPGIIVSGATFLIALILLFSRKLHPRDDLAE